MKRVRVVSVAKEFGVRRLIKKEAKEALAPTRGMWIPPLALLAFRVSSEIVLIDLDAVGLSKSVSCVREDQCQQLWAARLGSKQAVRRGGKLTCSTTTELHRWVLTE